MSARRTFKLDAGERWTVLNALEDYAQWALDAASDKIAEAAHWRGKGDVREADALQAEADELQRDYESARNIRERLQGPKS
ncbi:MAG: hypothetical protein LC750_07525 [Actinobacteria bacterium]|nr:hypothetical protein [Actinomycetota bacterium]